MLTKVCSQVCSLRVLTGVITKISADVVMSFHYAVSHHIHIVISEWEVFGRVACPLGKAGERPC